MPAYFTNPADEFFEVHEGDSLEIHSSVSNLSYPDLRYVLWKRGSKFITDGRVLRLKNISADISGVYENIVFNGYGKRATKKYYICLLNVRPFEHVQGCVTESLEPKTREPLMVQRSDGYLRESVNDKSKQFRKTVSYQFVVTFLLILMTM